LRVFVSSVIDGYEDVRKAAREAIQLLGDTPMMAEYDFGAKPMTPREACLEGVRGSDIYVGLFGSRYGYVTDRGISATEEEFEEAQQRGLPVLIFEEGGEKEERQAEFLNRVKDYGAGFFRDTYRTPEDLKDAVIKALATLKREASVGRRDTDGVRELLGERSSGLSSGAMREPWILVSICPLEEGLVLITSAELGREDVKSSLLRQALLEKPSVLRPELGFAETVEEEKLRWIQPAGRTIRQAEGVLEIHVDGVVQVGRWLEAEGQGGTSILRHLLIDEERVGEVIHSTLGLANGLYGAFESGKRIRSAYIQVRLGGIRNKILGRQPDQDPSSITMPMHSLDDPLIVPRNPQEVNRIGLAEPSKMTEEIVELIRRQFVLANAYYSNG
jgi:hypothetical protein